jgi:hypothetical protein
MNINLCNIIRRIAAEQGEAILSDPQRLKGYINDYAKNEPPAERLAFGRCIEYGAYSVLKSASDRAAAKGALARKVHDGESLDIALCAGALDALEAALFGAVTGQQPSPLPQTGALHQGAPGNAPRSDTMSAGTQKISKKTCAFGIAAGLGALAGELVSQAMRVPMGTAESRFDLIVQMGVVFGIISIFISAGLAAAQHIVSKKQSSFKSIAMPLLIGFCAGFISGGFAQFIFNYTQFISPAVRIISNALCWGLAGAGMGFCVAFFIPNYPKHRAALAGALGGTLGGIIYVATMSHTYVGQILGIIILGASIGFSISFIEEALREAWLTVVWAQNETTTVSLGERPVSFGSSREADVYLPRRPSDPSAPPVRAIFGIENGRVIMDDRLNGGRHELQNGTQVDLGRVRVIVHTKT